MYDITLEGENQKTTLKIAKGNPEVIQHCETYCNYCTVITGDPDKIVINLLLFFPCHGPLFLGANLFYLF